jgi:hypothetical protein
VASERGWAQSLKLSASSGIKEEEEEEEEEEDGASEEEVA